jgi:hypothetical protein
VSRKFHSAFLAKYLAKGVFFIFSIFKEVGMKKKSIVGILIVRFLICFASVGDQSSSGNPSSSSGNNDPSQSCDEIKNLSQSEKDPQLKSDLENADSYCQELSAGAGGEEQCHGLSQALENISKNIGANPHLLNAYYTVKKLYFSQCPDYLSDLDLVREFLEEIYQIADQPNARNFIDYLIGVLNNSEEYDSYTRYLAARDLVAISNHQSGAFKAAALNPVLHSLLNDRNELLRSNISLALSESKSPEVIPVVEYSYRNDPSAGVKEMDRRSLIILTNGAYNFESMLAGLSAMVQTITGTQNPAAENCLSEDQYQWIKRHIIITDPNLKLEDYRCQE